jgi:hypothetical protein
MATTTMLIRLEGHDDGNNDNDQTMMMMLSLLQTRRTASVDAIKNITINLYSPCRHQACRTG